MDGSSRGNPGLAGFGGLARGEDGRWIFSFYGSIGFAGNLLPELIAIYQGLRLAWDHGFKCVLCKSDSLEAIRLIYSSNVLLHHFQAVIMEIKFWLSKDWRVSVSHVCREENQCANHLAKLGASLEERLVILEEPPATIIPSLRLDHMGAVFERV